MKRKKVMKRFKFLKKLGVENFGLVSSSLFLLDPKAYGKNFKIKISSSLSIFLFAEGILKNECID